MSSAIGKCISYGDHSGQPINSSIFLSLRCNTLSLVYPFILTFIKDLLCIVSSVRFQLRFLLTVDIVFFIGVFVAILIMSVVGFVTC